MTNVSGDKKRLSAKQWWSQAWWEALSKRAVHDANRLPRGRTYARKGAVEIDSVSVGIVEASVTGSRPLPYATNLFLKTYNQESLEVIIQIMGSRVEFLAALLGGDDLDSLAEAHVIGEASANSRITECAKPSKSPSLIMTKCCFKSRWLGNFEASG